MSWPRFWLQKSWQTALLSPLSKLVCWEASRRLRAFQRHRPAKISKAVVIVVGNIVVGGSGKTPFIVWLTKELQAQGYKVGVISRGYGGQSKTWPIEVFADSAADLVGDEPLLLVRQLACPLAVSPKRNDSIALLSKNHDLDIIISDDGLQHFAMQRDIEVVMVDSTRQFGNQQCLPGGPLREPMSRLQTVDFLVWNGAKPIINSGTLAPLIENKQYSMKLQPACFRQVINPENCLSLDVFIDTFSSQKPHAIAGIGNPQRFFETLETLGISATQQAFADHYAYQLSDFEAYSDEKPLLMTEKDAVKCSPIAISLQKHNWWYLEVTPQAESALFDAIRVKVKASLS